MLKADVYFRGVDKCWWKGLHPCWTSVRKPDSFSLKGTILMLTFSTRTCVWNGVRKGEVSYPHSICRPLHPEGRSGLWGDVACGVRRASMKSGGGREAVSLQTKYFYSLVFIKWKQRISCPYSLVEFNYYVKNKVLYFPPSLRCIFPC